MANCKWSARPFLLLLVALAAVGVSTALAAAQEKELIEEGPMGAVPIEGAEGPAAHPVEAGERALGLEHDEHGHAAHIGEHGVNTDPSDFKSDLAIFSFIVFLLLMAILLKFAWKPIMAGLERREHNIAHQIESARSANEEAKRMLAQYEARLASAADEVRAILDEARRDAEHTQQEILAKAKADAEAEVARGKREIETATNAALKTLAEHHAQQAVALAARLIGNELNHEQHARLIHEAVDQFPAELSASRN